jgi:hypothetical protein
VTGNRKDTSLQRNLSICMNYEYVLFYSTVPLIKLFWHKFNYTFCTLYHCINVTIIFLCFEKVRLSKRESKFMPKNFYKIKLLSVRCDNLNKVLRNLKTKNNQDPVNEIISCC